MAWSQVGEWKKIIEKLMRAKVRTAPRTGPRTATASFRAQLVLSSSGAFPSSARAEDQHGHAEKDSLKDAEDEIIECERMPNPDDDHVEKDRPDQSGLTIISKRHRQRREQIVDEPERQTHMPAAPEFLNVDRGEGRIEIGRPSTPNSLPMPSAMFV